MQRGKRAGRGQDRAALVNVAINRDSKTVSLLILSLSPNPEAYTSGVSDHDAKAVMSRLAATAAWSGMGITNHTELRAPPCVSWPACKPG